MKWESLSQDEENEECQDYEDESSSLMSSFDETYSYPKPKLLKLVNKLKTGKQTNKAIVNESKCRQFKKKRAISHSERRFIQYVSIKFDNGTEPLQSKGEAIQKKKKREYDEKKNIKTYYEYGRPINGYSFISDSKINEWKESENEVHNKCKRDVDETFTQSGKNNDLLRSYWTNIKQRDDNSNPNNEYDDMIYLPIFDPITNIDDKLNPMAIKLQDIGISEDATVENILYRDIITQERIYDFYRETSRRFNWPLHTILKRERIRWHPDKIHNHCLNSRKNNGTRTNSEDERKKKSLQIISTTIFQIINTLWEEEEEEDPVVEVAAAPEEDLRSFSKETGTKPEK